MMICYNIVNQFSLSSQHMHHLIFLIIFVSENILLLPSWKISVTLWTTGSSIHAICSSIHAIFQARILEWVAISYSRGSSQRRDQMHDSCICSIGWWILYHWAAKEAPQKCVAKKNVDFELSGVEAWLSCSLAWWPWTSWVPWWRQMMALMSLGYMPMKRENTCKTIAVPLE